MLAQPRRGTAAFELLVGMVVLLGLMALLLAAGRAGLASLSAVQDVRQTAWQARNHQRSRDPFAPSRLSAGEDLIRRSAAVEMPGLPLGLTGRAEASHAVPTGSWDERDVPLSGSRPWLHPSIELVRPIGLPGW